jgi:hypothetical protein
MLGSHRRYSMADAPVLSIQRLQPLQKYQHIELAPMPIKNTTKAYSLSLKQTIDQILNKHQFGIDKYEPRNLTLNQVGPVAHALARAKRDTFCVTEPKLTAYVPGSDAYKTTYDWQTKRP